MECGICSRINSFSTILSKAAVTPRPPAQLCHLLFLLSCWHLLSCPSAPAPFTILTGRPMWLLPSWPGCPEP